MFLKSVHDAFGGVQPALSNHAIRSTTYKLKKITEYIMWKDFEFIRSVLKVFQHWIPLSV